LKLQKVEQLTGALPCTSVRSESPFPNGCRGHAQRSLRCAFYPHFYAIKALFNC
jgi:hypothetical protein